MRLNNLEIWKKGRPYSAPLPSINNLEGLPRTAPLLDIGCGYGRLLNHLRIMGFNNLYGVDFITEPLHSINYAKVVAANAEALPFKEKVFMGTFLVGVLSNILEDEKRKKVFLEASRISKENGILFVSAFAINRYYKEKYEAGIKEFGKYGIFRSNSGGIFRHVSEKEIKELISGAGFKIIKFQKLPFTTMHGNPAEGFVITARKLASLS
ncbi:MAG: class I SAM-dependent methyltransferase [Candidatus Aminicenantes bacterium]|nr:class I SAM-dependent methyltransferase [Candidatus Aminicenantes bacterium]